MDHVSNPRGYTTLWLSSPADCPHPPAENKAVWLDSHPDASLHQGRDWLEKAIGAVLSGRLPQSTDLTAGTLRYRFVFRGPEYSPPVCDLELMPSVKDVGGIPVAGKSLIVVAVVDHVLHFRVFAGDGKIALDTDEKKLTEKGGRSKTSGVDSNLVASQRAYQDRRPGHRFYHINRRTCAAARDASDTNGRSAPTTHRNYRTELIDYSGELIDPDLNDEGLVNLVRATFGRWTVSSSWKKCPGPTRV